METEICENRASFSELILNPFSTCKSIIKPIIGNGNIGLMEINEPTVSLWNKPRMMNAKNIPVSDINNFLEWLLNAQPPLVLRNSLNKIITSIKLNK